MINALDKLTDTEKMALNLNFVRGEVEDIIAKDEMANRHERYE